MSLHIYSTGPVCLSCCVPNEWDNETIEREVNLKSPPGEHFRWKVSDDKAFAGGEPHPSPCGRDSGRKHILLKC